MAMHYCCIHSNISFVKAAKSSFVNNNKLLHDDQPLFKKRCSSYAFTLLLSFNCWENRDSKRDGDGDGNRDGGGRNGNGGDGSRDGDGRWPWHCDGVSEKCEGWCWASPLSDWCIGKHNIERYGSVSWWCNGTLTVLLCVTVYYGDIIVYYCDSCQFPGRPKRWWSLAKWLPVMASPFSNTPYYA